MKERISVVANGTGYQACIFLGSPMLNRQCLTFDGGADGGCASLTRPTKTGYVLREAGALRLPALQNPIRILRRVGKRSAPTSGK